MVEVQSFDDSTLLVDAIGAFTNVVTWAIDADEFSVKTQELMDHMHLKIVKIENPRSLADRGYGENLTQHTARIVEEVRSNSEAIMYGDFHAWNGQIH